MALAAVVTTSLFEARWINPVWELIGMDTSAASAAILASVERIVASLGSAETADLDVSDTVFRESSWVPRTGRAWATMASAVRVGSSVCNSLIEHTWIGQCVLVGAFLFCFWASSNNHGD